MRRLSLILIVVLGLTQICGAQNLLPQPNKKGLWGYVNEKGKFSIKPIFQAAEPFSSDLACVKINGMYGYINNLGQFVISAGFDSAESFKGNLAKCSKNGRYGLVTNSGANFLEFDYTDLRLSKNKGFYLGRKAGDSRIYVITSSGAAPQISVFDEVSEEYHGHFAYVKSNGLYGYIDVNGKPVKNPMYLTKPEFTANGVAVCQTKTGYGMINTSLNNIVPNQYAYVCQQANGNYHYGNSQENFGVISPEGTILLKEGAYTQMSVLSATFYMAKSASGKYDLLNEKAETLLSNCDLSVSGDIVSYSSENETGKLNLVNGKRAVSVKGKDVWSSGPATKIVYEDPFIMWVDCNGMEHRMTDAGTAVFEGYTKVNLLAKGFYIVEKDSKCALANASGQNLTDWVEAVIPLLPDYVQLVEKRGYGQTVCAIFRMSTKKMVTGYDFAWVYTPNEYGFVPVKLLRADNVGVTSKLLKMMGDSFYIAGSLSEGFYPITDAKTKKMGVMTEKGKVLVSPKYDEVGEFHCGMCRVWIAEKGNGFINTSGTLVVSCKYPYVLEFGSIEGVKNYTQVWDNWGQSFYIDKKGNIANPDKVLREAYDAQRQNTWY